jgi:4-amino-4-deoxy-L-arabinose transferase-like glycosyltransferase
MLIWGGVARALLPLESQLRGWNSLGVPIIETQVWLAWAAGIALWVALYPPPPKAGWRRWIQTLKPQRLDLLIGIALWLAAVILWQSTPLTPSWFITTGRPPNNTDYYPNSDALVYDASAQTGLVGEGFSFFGLPYVRRPFLTFMISLLHLIGGKRYQDVVFLQILILALLPPMIYLLTRAIHHRISGVIAGVLLLLRETNAISVSANITSSHVKTLMSDLPSTLAVLMLTYLSFIWLKENDSKPELAILTGGALGIATLIRNEIFGFALPIAVLAALILFPQRRKLQWLKNMGLFLCGVTLVIAPWVWRNYQKTGLLFIDSPFFRADIIAMKYREITPPTVGSEGSQVKPPALPTPSPAETRLPVATPVAATTPGAPSTPSTNPSPGAGAAEEQGPQAWISSALAQAVKFAWQKPGTILRFVLAHYMNSQIQSFLLLPTTFRLFESTVGLFAHRSPGEFWFDCCSVLGYTRALPFWHKWDGLFPVGTLIPIAFNLALISMGVAVTWRKHKLPGLLPIIYSVTYFFVHALFRDSGGRYMLPANWSSLLFFSIGLAEMTDGIAWLFTGRKRRAESEPPISSLLAASRRNLFSPPVRISLVALGLFLLGCATPALEASLPRRYTEVRMQQMTQALFQSKFLASPQMQDLQTFLNRGGALFAGRALYPRFFPENLDDLSNKGELGPSNLARMTFYFAGQVKHHVYIPVAKKPSYFPNASDVLLAICPSGTEALAVGVFDRNGNLKALLYHSTPFPPLSCPTQSPINSGGK